MKLKTWACLVAAPLTGCAALPDTGSISGQNWTGVSQGPDTLRHYPADAFQNGVPGVVLVVCQMAEGGRLSDCEVAFENRPGWGFGAAALRMTEDIQVRESVPVGKKVMQIVGFCNSDAGCSDNQRSIDQIKTVHAQVRAEARTMPEGATR